MATPEPDTPQLLPGTRRILAIREGQAQIVLDHWLRLADDDPLPELAALPVLVSATRARSEREQLDARAGEWGVWVPGEAEPEAIARDFGPRPVIAIFVPKFTDGRHYSLARLLRERHGFGGQLRAIGDVLPDQLFYMRRCGYDAFELAPGKSLDTGLRTLTAFDVSYQGAADDPRPLYRRRA